MRKSSRAMSFRGSAFSSPWLQFHGGGAADVYIIIRVRASGNGESALNPPTSPPIPRRRSARAPAQRHALPEHFLTPFPRSSAPPRSADAHPQAAPCIPRRRPSLAPAATHPSRAFSHPLPAHFHSPTQRRRTPAELTTHSPSKICSRPRTTTRPSPALLPHPRSPDARPPTSRPIPCQRPSPATAQRHALPEHFRSSTQPRRTPAGYTMHARRPHNTFPAAPRCLPFRSASGTKKRHRTASVRCRMFRSTVVRSVIWGLCRASVRRRCGAVARQRGA